MTGLPAGWFEHRRGDGEIVGWIVAHQDGFLAFDVLGRAAVADAVDWLDAEAVLEAQGIGFLAERFVLSFADGTRRPVRISEASPRGIVVVADEYGAASAVGASADVFHLPFPAPPELIEA